MDVERKDVKSPSLPRGLPPLRFLMHAGLSNCPYVRNEQGWDACSRLQRKNLLEHSSYDRLPLWTWAHGRRSGWTFLLLRRLA
jgi:hypothetical protein